MWPCEHCRLDAEPHGDLRLEAISMAASHQGGGREGGESLLEAKYSLAGQAPCSRGGSALHMGAMRQKLNNPDVYHMMM